MSQTVEKLEVLLVEDNMGDVILAQEAFAESAPQARVNVAQDGLNAMTYLRQDGEYANAERPDLVLLDLNLPMMSGLQVLREMKRDENLRSIPVIVLSSSALPSDIEDCYSEHANCYVKKPSKLSDLQDVVKGIDKLWLTTARDATKRN